MPLKPHFGRAVLACAVLSVACAAFGFHQLLQYEARAGVAGTPAASRPSCAELPPASGRAELLIFAHPRCPCTRATLDNLDRLVARMPADVRTLVVLGAQGFDRPAIEDSELWQRAGELGRVERIADPEGALAHRFGVSTSGDARLYSAEGELLYAGGLTDARGHAGDFATRAALEQLLALPHPSTTDTAPAQRLEAPVFGCALEDS